MRRRRRRAADERRRAATREAAKAAEGGGKGWRRRSRGRASMSGRYATGRRRRRQPLPHGAGRVADGALRERALLEVVLGRERAQLPVTQEELRVARPPEPLVADHERLAHERAAGAQGGGQVGEQRPPQVVGHDDRVPLPLAERPGARLEVRRDDLDARVAQARERRRVAVDGGDAAASRGEELGVPPAAGGDVEDVAGRGELRGPRRDRRLRRGQAVVSFHAPLAYPPRPGRSGR